MKNFITSACLFAALALVSCNDNARLAIEVQGLGPVHPKTSLTIRS